MWYRANSKESLFFTSASLSLSYFQQQIEHVGEAITESINICSVYVYDKSHSIYFSQCISIVFFFFALFLQLIWILAESKDKDPFSNILSLD